MSDILLVERREAVAVVTLNRPDSLNALSRDLWTELRRTVTELDRDEAVRAIVLTGAGRAFSSGADLSGAPSDAEETVRVYANPLIEVVAAATTPVVVAVNGVAAGAGFSVALAGDLRVAATTASFQLPFAKIGLVPDAGATWFLPRAVGPARAAELALTGRKLGAEEALAWGLVNEVVEVERVVERAIELATTIAGLTRSVGPTKRLLRDALDRDLAGSLDAEGTAQGIAQHSADFQAVRAAFRAKREGRS